MQLISYQSCSCRHHVHQMHPIYIQPVNPIHRGRHSQSALWSQIYPKYMISDLQNPISASKPNSQTCSSRKLKTNLYNTSPLSQFTSPQLRHRLNLPSDLTQYLLPNIYNQQLYMLLANLGYNYSILYKQQPKVSCPIYQPDQRHFAKQDQNIHTTMIQLLDQISALEANVQYS